MEDKNHAGSLLTLAPTRTGMLRERNTQIGSSLRSPFTVCDGRN